MSNAQFRFANAIVSTDWLEANLNDPRLRIVECTTYLVSDAPDQPFRVESGRADYDKAHIPGAIFVDLQHELSDNASPFHFTMPSPDRFAEAIGRRGIGPGTQVVLYSRKSVMWATRVWWMLRSVGFDDAAILDGGWDKWIAEGRPASAEASSYPSAVWSAAPRSGLFVGKEEVKSSIGDASVCTINALAAEAHRGDTARYRRPGHIQGSVNVPAAAFIDPKTHELPPASKAAAAFAAVGADRARRVIAYCGGGIAASLDAFLLHQLGYEDVAIYDNSMSEWANDNALPMETG